MKKQLKRSTIGAAALGVLAVGHLAFAPRTAEAGDKHIYGVSNLGDTCSGTCGSSNICCRIVIVAPDS